MSNFNGNTGSSELTEGNADIFVNSVKINNISTPFLPLKTDSDKQVYSTTLDISDTTGLQEALDSCIQTPFVGVIQASDFKSDNVNSYNTTIPALVASDANKISKTDIASQSFVSNLTLTDNTKTFSAVNIQTEEITTPNSYLNITGTISQTGNQYFIENTATPANNFRINMLGTSTELQGRNGDVILKSQADKVVVQGTTLEVQCPITTTDTTQSTNPVTGSIQTFGGLGVVGNIYNGDGITTDGNLKLNAGILDSNDAFSYILKKGSGTDSYYMGDGVFNGSGNDNLSMGSDIGDATATGFNNVLLGGNVATALNASNTVIIGQGAGSVNANSTSVLVGAGAGALIAAGGQTCIGYRAGGDAAGGVMTAVGNEAGRNAGIYSTVVGHGSLRNGVNVSQATAIGHGTLVNTTGADNTALGAFAGDAITSGRFNCFLGSRTDGAATLDNQIAIGYQVATTAANQCIIGDANLTEISNTGDGVCDLGAPTRQFKDIYAAGDLNVGGNLNAIGANIVVSTVENLVLPATSLTTPYNYTASTTLPGTDVAWKAFDQNDSTEWRSAAGGYPTGTENYSGGSVTIVDGVNQFGAFVQVQFGSNILIDRIDMLAFDISVSRSPLSWVLAGSLNGTTWFTLRDETNSLLSTTLTQYNFPKKEIRYVRFIIRSTSTNALQSTVPMKRIDVYEILGGNITCAGDIDLSVGIKIGYESSDYNGIKSSGKVNGSLPDPNLFADELQMMRWSSGDGTASVQNNNIFELYSSVMLGEQANNRVIDNSVVLEVKSTAIFNDTEKSTVFKFLGNLDCQEAVICRKNVSITEELLVSGDIGRVAQKVPNIHCNNIFYTQANPVLRDGPVENVNISDTFLVLNDRIEKVVGSFVNFGGDESNIFNDRSYFNLNGESTSQTSSSINYDNTFLCPCDCVIKNISFIKRNVPLSSVQIVINQVINELHIFDLLGRGDVINADIPLSRGDIINLCFRNTNGTPSFGRYTLYLVRDSSVPSTSTANPITLNFDESDLLPPSKTLEQRIEELEDRLNSLVN